MPAPPSHGEQVEPLVHGGRRVIVDGHPICSLCGRGIVPSGPGRWRHLASGESFPERSPWLSPTPDELRRCATFEQFAATYPWAVSPDADGALATTPGQWREGMLRLATYEQVCERATAAPVLPPGENPYLELVGLLGALAPPPDRGEESAVAGQPTYWGLPHGLVQVIGIAQRRRELVQLFAWGIPTPAALELIGRCEPIVECGAGTGYWTALLRARGVDSLAYDVTPPGDGANEFHRSARRTWTEVGRASAVEAVRRHRDRTLMLCWPPLDDDAASYDALRAYRGELFVYVGEPGGTAGSVRFHRELELNWEPIQAVELPTWPRLEDRAVLFRRRPTRRPLRARDRCTECGAFVPTGTIGRCEPCFARRPPALALRVGRHRIEYSEAQLDGLPPPLRAALETSEQRIR